LLLDCPLPLSPLFPYTTLFRSHRVVSKFRHGRTFLLGDAAHIHSPVGGQGMNTGIGDAVNLAWKLAAVLQSRTHERVLDTYEPEDRKSTRLNSSHQIISYAVFC